jgi:chromosome segregation ATPase
MKGKVFSLVSLAAVAALVLGPMGCTPKKVQLQLQDQTGQIQKSQEQIASLQKANEGLMGNLKETTAALANAKAENKKIADQTIVLNTQVSTLQARNVELAKSADDAKAAGDENAKRIRVLNGQVNMLSRQKAEKEEIIAAKENEITSLRSAEAGLKATIAAKDAQISKLNEEKTVLAEETKKTVSGKNTVILILAVFLGLAIIAAILAFRKSGRKSPSL